MESVTPNPKVIEALTWLTDYAAANRAPITERVVRAQLPLLTGPTRVGQRMVRWPTLPWTMRCNCG